MSASTLAEVARLCRRVCDDADVFAESYAAGDRELSTKMAEDIGIAAGRMAEMAADPALAEVHAAFARLNGLTETRDRIERTMAALDAEDDSE